VNKVWIGRPDAEYRIKSFGLDESTTDEVLKDFFGQYGRVVEVYQFTWKDTNKKRGYGYITFEDTDVVDKLVLLGIHEVEGIKLQVKKALTKDVQEALEKKKLREQGGGGMDHQQDYNNSRGSTPSQSMGANNMGQQGYNNSMGGVGMGMNSPMDGMMNNPMMNTPMMNNPMMNNPMMMNQMQQQMNPMQQNMGGSNMMGQSQGAFNNPMMANNQLMNQMQQMPPMAGGMNANPMMGNMNNTGMMGGRSAVPAANNMGGGGGSGGNMTDMMQNMNSMMGSMKQEVQKGGQKSDGSDKIMGMMGNMMSMMSNMAQIMQTQVGGATSAGNNSASTIPSPVQPPNQTSSRPSRFDVPHSTNNIKRESAYNNSSSGNNSNQTSNYGHTYGPSGGVGSQPGSYPSHNNQQGGGGGSAYPDMSSRGWSQGGGSQPPQPSSQPPSMGAPPPSMGTTGASNYGSSWGQK